jgi:hypothetical protein
VCYILNHMVQYTQTRFDASFAALSDATRVVMHHLYPSKEALDGAIASGSTNGFSEAFEQLDELLVTPGASVARTHFS